VTVDPKLKAALQKKFGVTERHINRLITERSQALALPREHAAIAIALDSGVNVTRFADEQDLAAIRHARSAATPDSVPPAPAPQPARPARRRKAAPRKRRSPKKPGKKIWVVYGRNDKARTSLFRFLRALELTPVEFSSAIKDTRSGSPYVGEILEKAFASVHSVVVLLTGDDEARLRGTYRKKSDPDYEAKLTPQLRPNVLFEAGMAFGRYPRNTVVVQIGGVRPFSDIVGRHVIHLDNTSETRTEFANRLGGIGCALNMSGTDWLSEGDFES